MEKPELLSKEDYNLIHKDIIKNYSAQITKNGIQSHELMLKLTLKKI